MGAHDVMCGKCLASRFRLASSPSCHWQVLLSHMRRKCTAASAEPRMMRRSSCIPWRSPLYCTTPATVRPPSPPAYSTTRSRHRRRRRDIAVRFGPDVAALVAALTENPSVESLLACP